jgi:hypothetical protein
VPNGASGSQWDPAKGEKKIKGKKISQMPQVRLSHGSEAQANKSGKGKNGCTAREAKVKKSKLFLFLF